MILVVSPMQEKRANGIPLLIADIGICRTHIGTPCSCKHSRTEVRVPTQCTSPRFSPPSKSHPLTTRGESRDEPAKEISILDRVQISRLP